MSAYEPDGQGVHAQAAAPAVSAVPTGQGAQEETEELAAYVPLSTHPVHFEEPGGENFPVVHDWQTPLPDPENVPALQMEQFVDPAGAKNPAEHLEHLEGEDAKLPAAHCVHDDDPATDTQPERHAVQFDAPAAEK